MKKIKLLGINLGIVIAVSLLMGGCSQTFTHVDKQESITSLDFTKYKNDNFLITPGDYGENYEALGMFSFTIYPEANYVSDKAQDNDSNEKFLKWKQGIVAPQEVLDLAYKTAITKNANAITHFKIKNIDKVMNDGIHSFVVTGLEISGLLIKRK